MSANTRRQKTAKRPKRAQRTSWLAQLAALFGTATTLILADKRRDTMVRALITALQLFKENRLGATLRLLDRDQERPPEEIQKILSARWTDTALPIPTKRYLSQLGVLYVGEVFQISWVRAHRHREAIEAQLFELGIPMDLDPIATGWKPEYWDNPMVLEQLAWSLDRLFQRSTYNWRMHHGHGKHYVSQYLDTPRTQTGTLKEIQTALKRTTVLHAAMMLPPNFTCPDEIPSSWLDFQKREAVLKEARLQKLEKQHDARLRRCREHPDEVWQEMRANFSVRLGNCLDHERVASLRELVALREDQMLFWRNFGRVPLKQVSKLLDSFGLRLGMSAEEIEQVFGPLES